MKPGRLRLLFTAWVVGHCTYLIKEMLIVHDWKIAIAALLLGWAPAVLYSASFVAVALFVGLVLRVPLIGRAWHANPRFAVWLLVASVAALVVSPYVGLSEDLHFDGGGRVTMLNPAVWFTSYTLIIFVVAHWPEGKSTAEHAVTR